LARKRSVLQLLIILVLLALAPMYATGVFQTVPSGQIIWSQNSNPIGGYNYAEDVAVDTSGIYVVGSDQSPGNSEWRIEKRGLTNGSLISTFGSGGVVTSNPSDVGDRALGVAVDASGVYIVGYDQSLGNLEWRIEKRALTDGSLIWSQTENPSLQYDVAHGVAVDGSGVYIVGWDFIPGSYEWRMEKRNLGIPASKLVVTVSPSAVTAGSWTSKYTVQRQDQYGNPVTFGSTTVDLASTSTGTNKKFSETTGGTAVTSVTILDGSSTKDFYYYDDKAGSWSVSVSATGLTGDTKPLTVNPKTGCIIATAAYGSEMAPEVAYMRHVRDVMIGSSEVGRLLVSGWNAFYYSWSPPIAQFIESHDAVKPIFRVLLLPLVGIIHATALIYPVFASVNSAFGSVVAFLFASVLSTLSYVMMPIFAARKIHRIHSKV